VSSIKTWYVRGTMIAIRIMTTMAPMMHILIFMSFHLQENISVRWQPNEKYFMSRPRLTTWPCGHGLLHVGILGLM
jgi:hypothetical protein